ncbi:AAA family ATPase [archaeon]|nr:AAA family ATPase [archaeon]
MVSRIKTGVPGFDKLIDGGLPKGSVSLVSGPTGSGKTTLCGQFLMSGAKAGEPGLLVTLEQDIQHISEEWENFGLDVSEFVKKGKLFLLKPQFHNMSSMLSQLEDVARTNKIMRVAFDSASIVGLYSKDLMQVRQNMLTLFNALKQLNCTSLVTSEVSELSQNISTYGIEEFLTDGVIVLHYIFQDNQYHRAISVRKMKLTNHSQKLHPLKIEKNGLVVYSDQVLFAKVR